MMLATIVVFTSSGLPSRSSSCTAGWYSNIAPLLAPEGCDVTFKTAFVPAEKYCFSVFSF